MHVATDELQQLKKEISADYKIIASKNNLPIFEVNGFVTNSKYNPIAEAEKLADTHFKKNSLHILIGIGSGFFAEELYKKISESESILIIEPNIELFKELMQVRTLDFLRDEKKVTYIVGLDFESIEQFVGIIVEKFNNRLELFISPNYEKIYPLYVKKVMIKIKESLMFSIVQRNTLLTFSGEWQENFINNIYHAFTAIPFSSLHKKMSCPVVIVSGGPSLSKHIELIKHNRSLFFLLCAGSTINTLLANDIVPDAIVSVDGGINNYHHFESLGNLNVPLFFSTKIHKDILNIYEGKKVVFNNAGETRNINIMNDLIGFEIGDVIGGPSVANFSLDIAYKLTSGPICLIGQDLAYTNNATHAEGNKNFSIIDEKKIKGRNMFYVHGHNGEEVLTDYSLFSMKKTFEMYIHHKMSGEDIDRVYNCTEGGAIIEGCENIPFSTFINNFCKLNDSNQFESLLNRFENVRTQEQWENVKSFVSKQLLKSVKVKKICKEATDILNIMDNSQPTFSIHVTKQLDKIDKKLKKLLENDFLLYIFGEVIYNVENNYLAKENETNKEKQKRLYLKSIALYKGIYSATDTSINWLDDLIEKISKELLQG